MSHPIDDMEEVVANEEEGPLDGTTTGADTWRWWWWWWGGGNGGTTGVVEPTIFNMFVILLLLDCLPSINDESTECPLADTPLPPIMLNEVALLTPLEPTGGRMMEPGLEFEGWGGGVVGNAKGSPPNTDVMPPVAEVKRSCKHSEGGTIKGGDEVEEEEGSVEGEVNAEDEFGPFISFPPFMLLFSPICCWLWVELVGTMLWQWIEYLLVFFLFFFCLNTRVLLWNDEGRKKGGGRWNEESSWWGSGQSQQEAEGEWKYTDTCLPVYFCLLGAKCVKLFSLSAVEIRIDGRSQCEVRGSKEKEGSWDSMEDGSIYGAADGDLDSWPWRTRCGSFESRCMCWAEDEREQMMLSGWVASCFSFFLFPFPLICLSLLFFRLLPHLEPFCLWLHHAERKPITMHSRNTISHRNLEETKRDEKLHNNTTECHFCTVLKIGNIGMCFCSWSVCFSPV